MSENSIALIDQRPFFEVALCHGVQTGIITEQKLQAIEQEAPKGIVQIAATFGSKYLRAEIESAAKRIVNLASLYLLETSKNDLEIAAKMIRDATFLSLSRGGSGLLKTLFAMPEYAMLGHSEKGRVEDFLEYWSLRDNPLDYRKALQHRQTNQAEIEAAYWFGAQLGISQSALQEEDVEACAVIRSAMLLVLFDQPDVSILNQIEFAVVLETIRSQSTAKPLKKSKTKLSNSLEFAQIPQQYHAIAERIKAEIEQQDLPKILNQSLTLDRLVYELKERYFIRDHEMEDTSEYDALVSKEWTRLTKGKSDIDSLLTLFLCITAGVEEKTTLTEKAAKALVKKIRQDGLNVNLAQEWIKTAAPHEKQAGLLEDWRDFAEDAENYLLDDWDTNYSGALRFLAENCHIQKAAKK